MGSLEFIYMCACCETVKNACTCAVFMYALKVDAENLFVSLPPTLSTWSGPPWSAAQSLLSILLSIQSLLCEKPYHNEPGYENVSY